ncbi:ATP-binding protein [Euzebya tangerina]|uniref:ATP-binding protein n=1 Tax=Euzebya tangerina TaxID=591198 RepID=UPI000E31A265|nr:ATP-binding protein [Euzebya tangerina]
MTTVDVTPSARRLTGSLRDIGYDLNTAVADLVDNAIEAGARHVDIQLIFDGLRSKLVIADDGVGMTSTVLDEALRFGTRRDYERNALGRYGLGLKTASISQGRRLTVITRSAPQNRRLHARRLDLDHIAGTDRWEVVAPSKSETVRLADGLLDDGPGTVLVVDNLDRVLPERNPEGGWARRRFVSLASKLGHHLGMVFHRFLSGEAGIGLTITLDGEKIRPWDPFCRDEEHTLELPAKVFHVEVEGERSSVWLRPFVLPARRRFSSADAFERAGGPGRWNRQQGLYIYRADRLIQAGGWSGLRAQDEHTKLARSALEFETEADEVFRINVAKMRVSLPAEIRPLLGRPVQELCNRANAAYRMDARSSRPAGIADSGLSGDAGRYVGSALFAAASEIGELDALMRVFDRVGRQHPDVSGYLGLS